MVTLDNIEIATGPYDQTTNVPLFSHPLADEPIAYPLFSRIDQVYIAELSKQDRISWILIIRRKYLPYKDLDKVYAEKSI